MWIAAFQWTEIKLHLIPEETLPMHKVLPHIWSGEGGGKEGAACTTLPLTITEEKQHEDQNGISVAGVNWPALAKLRAGKLANHMIVQYLAPVSAIVFFIKKKKILKTCTSS